MFWQNLWEAIEASMTNGFVNIITWIAISLLFFQFLNYFSRDKFELIITKSEKTQPLLAGILGIVPGCGGTLFLVPLYNKGKLTYGALTASFISTMGDASFIILTQEPLFFIYASLISIVVGIIVGYGIDLIGVDKKINVHADLKTQKKFEGHPEETKKNKDVPEWTNILFSNAFPIIFWIAIFAVFPMSIMQIAMPNLGDIIDNKENIHIVRYDIFCYYVSMIIMFSLIPYYLIRKWIYSYYYETSAHMHYDPAHKGGIHKEDVAHIWRDVFAEVLFMSIWVFFGILFFEFLIISIGESNIIDWLSDQGALPLVFIGSFIGLIPGCGPQIVFASFFISFAATSDNPWLLFPALLANSISQDGDAGFPLLATNRKSFMWIKIINLIPSLIVGISSYFIIVAVT